MSQLVVTLRGGHRPALREKQVSRSPHIISSKSDLSGTLECLYFRLDSRFAVFLHPLGVFSTRTLFSVYWFRFTVLALVLFRSTSESTGTAVKTIAFTPT